MKSLSTISMTLALTLACLSVPASAEPAADGIFYIKAKHSNKCVHQHGHINNNGGNVTQWDCVNQGNTKLERIPTGSGYFLLRFKHSGKCVTVENDSLDRGANIIQWDCNYDGPRNQTWHTLKASNNPTDPYVQIQSGNGACLHQHGATNGNGDNITQWDCVNEPNVLWKFTPAPN
ncbi:MAG TPA: RICIN domain-containing protein [Candidatus Thiothrix moscowensis]|uniref:RICIN domain-containing protein n=1 Tax=unclassified Thiothrix TaxID=2636184 RepID=UPI0025EFDA71|nr:MULTISPECIES: RICIN domain-containing protein [unclassified Thiothrix]HRJ53753.1 RICIN domain-containing protein [Candidatus Thiothrix moscowensis]HRJ93835.1 RICIN domain-containing protein [Candidatus Thiothrix moscowensis]